MILEIKDLKVYFPIYGGKIRQKKIGDVKAVDGVDLSIEKQEILSLVGESGCGKTTLAKAVLGILPKTSGSIVFEGSSIDKISYRSRKELSREIQYVSQDPFLALDPKMRISDVIAEGLDIHKLAESKQKREEKIINLMELVDLDLETRFRYPIEFSAGQRQRVAIARALALSPKFLVCDEPVSSLDVSVQDQILKLLLSLQERFGLTILFITHDLAVVKMISDKVAVMYLGKIVEYAKSPDLYSNPLHPYTKILLSSVPKPDPTKTRGIVKERIQGEVPSAQNIPLGCRFHPRCPLVSDKCKDLEPVLTDKKDGHFVACHKETQKEAK